MNMKSKRSQNINLARMLKRTALPASALAAAVALSGCGAGEDEGYLYASVSECVEEHPGKEEICQSAFEEAQYAALESGPRYASESLCEMEFGFDQCVPQDGGSFWTPFVAGFIVSELIDEVGDFFEYKKRRKRYGDYYATPAFLSTRGGKPRYYGLNEQKFGNLGQRKVGVVGSAFKKQPTKVFTSKTIRRGGFGSTVRSSSRSGGRSFGG